MTQISETQRNLTNLLSYAEQMLRITERFTTDLAKDSVAHFHEQDLIVLEGVRTNLPDSVWLRVDRLAGAEPPTPPDAYLAWMKPQSAGRFDRPALVDQRMERLAIEVVSDLAEAGLIDAEDALAPIGVTEALPDAMDVLLRLSRLDEFAAAFEAWVDGPWSAWARVELPRRRSIAFYNKLFEAQQRIVAMGEDAAIECVLGVGIARWMSPQARFDLPLIEATVELDLDPEDGAILVRPRPMAPRVSLRAFEELGIVSGGTLVRDAAERLQRSYDDADIGFSPFEPQSFDMVLRMCHARLSSSAIYLPDAEQGSTTGTLPAPDDTLRISDTWVLFLRQRSADFRCDDIRRLIDRVQSSPSDDALPAAAVQLTSAVADKVIDDDFGDLRDTSLVMQAGSRSFGRTGGTPGGTSASRSAGGDERSATPDEAAFLFPLPSNEEQREIIRRLDDPDRHAVVVQGPPGTGKTHTIANIICHYMATGRRVLVSARTAEALSAIQHKLPKEIGELAISVLHSDREGGRKLEHAIDILSTEIKQIDGRAYADRRWELEAAIARTRQDLADVDSRILAYADLNLAPTEFRGEQRMPMDLVRLVQAERPDHAWFEDVLSPDDDHEPRFTARDIIEARQARRQLAGDIIYPTKAIPDPAALPDTARVLAAHAALGRQRSLESRTARGDLPYVSYGPSATPANARDLRVHLQAFSDWIGSIPQEEAWIPALFRMLLDPRPADPLLVEKLGGLVEEWASLYVAGRAFLFRGLHLPDVPVVDAAFDTAVVALSEGRKPFGFLSFGKSALKMRIDSVRIEDQAPATAAEWEVVRAYRQWQKSADNFLGRWSPTAAMAGLPRLSRDWEPGSHELMRLGRFVDPVPAYQKAAAGHARLLAALFPHGVNFERVLHWGETSQVLEALQASEERATRADLDAVAAEIDAAAGDHMFPLHQAITGVHAALGDPAVAAAELAEAWGGVLDEARRLADLKPDRERLEAVARRVSASGAPVWARKLLSVPAEGHDPLAADSWPSAWSWARANGQVRRLAERSGLAKLIEQHKILEDRQRDLMGELVKVRTYLGLKRSITERIASALAKFAATVRKLGAGTGKAAERHRRAIRAAVLEAAEAVPCWILPEWRVAEQLPSELAAFDLVVIDEASQSDITALPVVMRGRKLLIVGDDRQVSPSAVGMEERTVVQLRQTFLRGMPVENYLDPTTSLYDLASMMFPGSTIMLREHFRCVEPIIRFSSRFYPKALIPLRLPTAAERLDPPLVDIYLPHGRKLRDINAAEVEVIVGEIARLVSDPAFAGRSIGVVSLIGDKQAKRIYERLTAEIGTEAFTRHRIMCGNASTFQGQERDIMFLSMVACPETARAQTARMMEQRYNVAMSRARDRMYLVRSVTASMLSDKDLKYAVIEHFRNPMGSETLVLPDDILDLCDSDFERAVGRRLLEQGYRITPQVPVGGFRIDFVVEGQNNRRLAVELDGDRYHGPDRWADDLRRQRSLERIGWVFWRCWGSHWLADPDGCFQDLLTVLGQQGIEPIGGDHSPRIYTEHRVIDPAGSPVDGGSPGEDGPAEGGVLKNESGAASPADAELPVLVVDNPEPSGTPIGKPQRDDRSSRLMVVDIGDTVIVRYADDNRVRLFHLSQDVNDPERGIVHVGQPIGAALIGNGVEEEVELIVGGQARTVIIEKVTKAA